MVDQTLVDVSLRVLWLSKHYVK